MAEDNGNWERRTIEKLAFAALAEQRRARRWGIFFKLLAFAYVTFLVIVGFDWRGAGEGFRAGKHTALVDISGVISAEGQSSGERVIAALQDAFRDSATQGVVLRINSPGGSPVQAGIIYDEIRRLREKYPSIPLYAVIEDMCASGGYYVASAADRIYADKASIVGSIGVVMAGWGFTGTMDKLGVERRVLTAGENKAFLDPFLPLVPEQKKHAQALLDDIHEQFIEVVKKGRGARLKPTPELFSGLFWTGEQSVKLGLADGLGSLDWVAREVVKAESIVDFTRKQNIAERFARRFGAAAAQTLAGWMGEAGVRLR
ncbi:MAG: S49 family peptidase [Burkholderiales bacterium]|nr:S49 family peptidase [Burkholderiales bacterium]